MGGNSHLLDIRTLYLSCTRLAAGLCYRVFLLASLFISNISLITHICLFMCCDLCSQQDTLLPVGMCVKCNVKSPQPTICPPLRLFDSHKRLPSFSFRNSDITSSHMYTMLFMCLLMSTYFIFLSPAWAIITESHTCSILAFISTSPFFS